MTRKHPQLSAARYFGHPDCTWWAVPQVLNFYHCPLPEYRDLRLINQHPGLLYLVLHNWAKTQPKAVQQAGRHFWHQICLLYTSPSPRDLSTSRMPSSA